MGHAVEDILRAAGYAARKHAAQRRKGLDQEPYINHLIEVAGLLARAAPDDPNLIIAGLLHDTIEDARVTREELAAEFGEDVAGLVMEVTDDKTLEKGVRKELQIRNAPFKSPRARLLGVADKISNLSSLRSRPPVLWTASRRHAYVVWARQVVNGYGLTEGFLKEEFDRVSACFDADGAPTG